MSEHFREHDVQQACQYLQNLEIAHDQLGVDRNNLRMRMDNREALEEEDVRGEEACEMADGHGSSGHRPEAESGLS